MTRQMVLATLGVFVAWMLMDFVIHGFILAQAYQSTAPLWRPMEEMNRGLMTLVCAVSAFLFTLIYARLVAEKSLKAGLEYGTLFGLVLGIGMGLGSYSAMPIPISLAVGWFLGTVVEGTVAGAMLGFVFRSHPA